MASYVLHLTASTMTAIKHALQRDIFTPNDERLLGIVNVCKAGKKKKNCFLCATGDCGLCRGRASNYSQQNTPRLCASILHISHSVTTERPVQVKVVKVKKSDKGDFYKRQQTWELRDLIEVDAKDASKVGGITICLFWAVAVFCPLFVCSL